MGYGWSSRDRLCPMRMVDLRGHNYHRFEVKRMRRKRLRAWTRLPDGPREPKFELHRWKHTVAAGMLGRFPVMLPWDKRPRRRQGHP